MIEEEFGMARTKRITESISYSAALLDRGNVELKIEISKIDFVEEVIPDGQMAGMMGHRPVPCTETYSFDLHPDQARMLWEQIGHALEG
jgi:hypothetical protein